MASSSSCAPSDFELQLVARAGLQSLHSFISLFSPASSSSSSSLQPQLQELQHHQSMAAATDTIINFKHLGTLLSQRKGHARVRQAPSSLRPTILKPNSPLVVTPNFSPSASESFQFSQIGLPASLHGTGSYNTSFNEECDTANFVDDGHSIRGSSSQYIDLNNQIDNSDYYEGSINTLSSRGYYIANDYNNTHNNYAFSSIINDINNPSSLLDLNQQAPSLDSSSSLTSSVHIPPNCLESKYNYRLGGDAAGEALSDGHLRRASPPLPSRPPLYCPQPILAFPPPSREEFSFDTRTQSAGATLVFAAPSASNTPSVPSSDDEFQRTDDEFSEFANNQTTLYGGHDYLKRQLAQIISTDPNFEAHLEKAACMIPKPTNSHISCISLEGNLPPTNGSVPPVQKPQPAVGSIMDQKASSAGKRKICPDDSKLTKCGNSPSKCHCAKSRKLKNRSVKRVPAISDKISEIPHDAYSWRKYGQKPIKGSPYPRGYYKCSSVKGCPAKKHVERALDDPSMLIITYESEHIHSKPILEEPFKYEGSSPIN